MTINNLPKDDYIFSKSENFGEGIDENIPYETFNIPSDALYKDNYSRYLFYINYYLYDGKYDDYKFIYDNVKLLEEQTNSKSLTIIQYIAFMKGEISTLKTPEYTFYLTNKIIEENFKYLEYLKLLPEYLLRYPLDPKDLEDRYNNKKINKNDNSNDNNDDDDDDEYKIINELVYYLICNAINKKKKDEKIKELEVYKKDISTKKEIKKMLYKNDELKNYNDELSNLNDDNESVKIRSRNNLYNEYYILYYNILFLKESTFKNIEKKINEVNTKYNNNDIIKNFINKTKKALEEIKKISDNNKENFKFDEKSKLQTPIYIIKTGNSLSINKVDNDDASDKRKIDKYRDQYRINKIIDINTIIDDECIYIIRDKKTLNNIPDYILYHDNFIKPFYDYKEDLGKMSEKIKIFNKKIKFLILLNNINKDNNDDNNDDDNLTGIKEETDYGLPYQYLLFDSSFIEEHIIKKTDGKVKDVDNPEKKVRYYSQYHYQIQNTEYFNNIDSLEVKPDYTNTYEYEKNTDIKKKEDYLTTKIPEYFQFILKGKKSNSSNSINIYENASSFPIFKRNIESILDNGDDKKKYKNELNHINNFNNKMTIILKKLNIKIKKYCKFVNAKNLTIKLDE